MVAEGRTGATHRHDLGMRTRVVLGDVAVPPFADKVAVRIDDQRTDGDFIVLALGAFGECERLAHPAHITDTGIFNPLLPSNAHSHSMVAGGLPEMS